MLSVRPISMFEAPFLPPSPLPVDQFTHVYLSVAVSRAAGASATRGFHQSRRKKLGLCAITCLLMTEKPVIAFRRYVCPFS